MASSAFPRRAHVVTGPAGAAVYRSKVRRSPGETLRPGMLAAVTQVLGNYRMIATGHARPLSCYLVRAGRPEACGKSHVHSFLVHVRDLQEAPDGNGD